MVWNGDEKATNPKGKTDQGELNLERKCSQLETFRAPLLGTVQYDSVSLHLELRGFLLALWPSVNPLKVTLSLPPPSLSLCNAHFPPAVTHTSS